ncbi:MAG: 2-amino-4-hydroxy-6-hydroxymethyldihydropteridine diphosphokinase, partial [Alphaproteobacteria bacterium]|nr:2-amino-4-hydroxy-6-hydroxymethyldihydropteridine diphosphokinase [Alphaproteobacteria bacterium]
MILIGLGANLEGKDGLTPAQSLQYAVTELQQASCGVDVIAGSSIWKTAPVPISDQPWYHNAVCQVETFLSAQELLQVIVSIENKAGRVRTSERNESRVLDLDIL